MAKAPLSGVQLVGSRLALMQGEASVRLTARGTVRLGNRTAPVSRLLLLY